jgi:hypothetical protein
LIKAVRQFEDTAHQFSPQEIREAAMRFHKENFKKEYKASVERIYNEFKKL